MKKTIIFIILISLFFQCKEKKGAKRDTSAQSKKEIIFAENIYDLGGIHTLKLYADSSYEFNQKTSGYNYEKSERYRGWYSLKEDTVIFSPSGFRPTNSEKAVIKNNFIELLDGEFPLKIKIKKSAVEYKQKENLRGYEDYSFFIYNSEFYSCFSGRVKPYDLVLNDLKEIDSLLSICIKENSRINFKKGYYKQCIAVINAKNEREVWVNCACKNSHSKNVFENQIIDVCDGGGCYFKLKINLAKRKYYNLSINGDA